MFSINYTCIRSVFYTNNISAFVLCALQQINICKIGLDFFKFFLSSLSFKGENIADNGGVKQAFHAYLHWLDQHDAAHETLPGINHTHTQLFFLNFAQVLETY